MLAYLILAKLIICGAPQNALDVNNGRVPVLAASKQVNDLLNLRALFPEVRWPPIELESGKLQRAAKPIPFFETTDFNKVWRVVPPRTSLSATSVLAQVTKDPLGLSPEDRKRYDEHLRDADRSLLIGYIAAGAGVACIVVGVALMIYRDYKKRKSAGH